ncbi:hypothetical protein GW17_00055599 [Ensete ventricosum]|nr:hypothetical protein GW17_00055599 [Ensete ventricosum]
MCSVSRKNATVINFAQSHVQRRASIGLWCTISEFQNTDHSQSSRPWDIVQAQFYENTTVINFVQSRVSIGFSCTILKFENTGHSQRICPWEVIRAWFLEKIRWS